MRRTKISRKGEEQGNERANFSELSARKIGKEEEGKRKGRRVE